MKIIVSVVVVLGVFGVGYWVGNGQGKSERDAKFYGMSRVYVLEPSTPLKKEHSFRVVSVCKPEDDTAILRNDRDTWRLYFPELNAVVYVVQRTTAE